MVEISIMLMEDSMELMVIGIMLMMMSTQSMDMEKEFSVIIIFSMAI
jgi:hypothetical protein